MISNPYTCNTVPQTTECKTCSGQARVTGVVDFSRCGADVLAGRKVEPYSGTPVYYYLCGNCGFVFTRAFDHWTTNDFAQHIYNADYVRHDPDYLDARPRANAQALHADFGASKATSRVLDYGSGLGLLEKHLRELGFANVESFDPFTSPDRPRGRFDMITCFEVFEHSTRPADLMADLKSMLTEDGAILFSTLLCTPEIVSQGIANWWYCGPRNGHVSFFSAASLLELGRKHGLQLGSFNAARHVFYQTLVPVWLAPRLAAEHWH